MSKMNNRMMKISGTFWICLWLCLILFSLNGIRNALEELVKQNKTQEHNNILNMENK
jgi:hypothetical protein